MPILLVLLQASVKGGGGERFPPAIIALAVLVLLALVAVGVALLLRRRPSRRLQGIFAVVGLLCLAAGSVLLTLIWLGIGVSDNGMTGEARGFAFLIIWPVTMLAVWLFGTIALAAGGRGLLVVVYLVAWLIVFFAVWLFVASLLLAAPGLLGAFFFAVLNAVAILLALQFVRAQRIISP